MKKQENLAPPDIYLLGVVLALVTVGLLLVFDASYARMGDAKWAHFDSWYAVKRQLVYACAGLVAMFIVARMRLRDIPSVDYVPAYFFSCAAHGGEGARARAQRRQAMDRAWPVRNAAIRDGENRAGALPGGNHGSEKDAREAPERDWLGPHADYRGHGGAGIHRAGYGHRSGPAGNGAGDALCRRSDETAPVRTCVRTGRAGRIAVGFSRIGWRGSGSGSTPGNILTATAIRLSTRSSGWGPAAWPVSGFARDAKSFIFRRPPLTLYSPPSAEEAGLIGGIILIALFIFFTWRGLDIARRSKSTYGNLLAVGVTSVISLQALINIAVVSASIPATGVPLPFISYGGSSLVLMMIGVGMLLSISRQVNVELEERDLYESSFDRWGDGGHIYPAISVGQALREDDAGRQSACSSVARTGRKASWRGMPGSSLGLCRVPRSPSRSPQETPARWVSSPREFFEPAGFWTQFKPDVVLGTGGYTTAAVLMAQWLRGGPVVIHEQNAVPGRTNLWLGRISSKICVSLSRFFEVVFSGGQGRGDGHAGPAGVLDTSAKGRGPSGTGPCGGPVHVLVVGGSQGAKKLNDLMLGAWPLLDDGATQVVHQVGERNVGGRVREIANAEVYHFSAYVDMPPSLAAADIVIARSGASTIAEVTCAGVPAVLVPYPYAYAGHQKFTPTRCPPAARPFCAKKIRRPGTLAELCGNCAVRTASSRQCRGEPARWACPTRHGGWRR